jgi:alpha-L-rhamnosidase
VTSDDATGNQPQTTMRSNSSLPIRITRGVLRQLVIPVIGMSSALAVVPFDLRCEYLGNPLGIDAAVPRFSWKIADVDALRGQKQTAWEILAASGPEHLAGGNADLWSSGVVRSSQSVLVPYGGQPLSSNQTVFWQVRVHDKDGKPSPWSDPARFTMGLLEADDWQGPWIHHPDARVEKHIWFRRNVKLDQPVDSALIHIASLGYHELFINGRKATDHHLAPAASRLDKRVLYLSYDIAEMLEPGDNTIAIWHGPGWARYSFFNTRPALRVQMHASQSDGKRLTLASDAEWRCEISSSENAGGFKWGDMGGERIDARRHLEHWNKPGFDDSGWALAKEAAIGVTLSAQMMEPTRVIETIPAKSIVRQGKTHRVDMGKNFTGWLEIRMRGLTAGDEVMIQVANRVGHAEDFNQRSFFISAGGKDEVFRHRFNYMAGRYVTLTGLESEPRPEDITGRALSTGLRQTGAFSSSNDLLNRIYEADLWTWRANLTEGYTMDCPHRERLGYGEVAFACAWGIALPNYDSGAMVAKHVRDWSDVQEENGWIHHTAPQINRHYGGPMWSSAGLNVAWSFYQHHGDRRVLETTYPSSRRWLEFLNSKVSGGLLRNYNEHWGKFLGDWAAPGGRKERGDSPEAEYFNNCVYAMNLADFIAMAEILGHQDDAELYRKRLVALRERVHEAYYEPDQQTYSNGTQVQLAFALLAGITPDGLRPTVAASLQRELREKPYLDMGSSGLPVLFKHLIEEADDNKVLFDHLTRTGEPGYGHFLERGETTWPEYWNVDVPSRIHTCYTGVSSWFTKSLAGIRPDPAHPGFQSFLIQPVVAGDLTFAEGRTESPYGTIRSRWEKDGDRFILEVTIPPNSQATVHLPVAEASAVTESGVALAEARGVTPLRAKAGDVVLRVVAGTYRFEAR